MTAHFNSLSHKSRYLVVYLPFTYGISQQKFESIFLFSLFVLICLENCIMIRANSYLQRAYFVIKCQSEETLPQILPMYQKSVYFLEANNICSSSLQSHFLTYHEHDKMCLCRVCETHIPRDLVHLVYYSGILVILYRLFGKNV